MGLGIILRRTFKSIVSFRPRDLLVSRDDNGQHSIDHVTKIPFFQKPLEQDEDEKPYNDSLDRSDATSLNTERRTSNVRRAPTVIQLFYDLFFVANLSGFNAVHEVNDTNNIVPTSVGRTLAGTHFRAAALKSYIGFFSILWFTWLQVAMFDVRFSGDSVFERLCKALQLGVMLGLAIVGPGYNVGLDAGNEEDTAQNVILSTRAFKILSLILMASRLVLCVQYGAVLFWMRKSKNALLPLALSILVNFCAAMIFLGLFFAFNPDNAHSSKAVDGWYVIVGLEAASVLVFSTFDRFASFRKSYIVERLGLLTLILLGEGVIGLCSAIQKLSTHQDYSSELIGMIACAAIVIYFLWVFYFDQVEAERVGTLRQIVWVLLHFPYHVSILLVLEGTSQMTLWQKYNDVWDALANTLFNVPEATSNSIGELRSVVTALNDTIQALAVQFTPPGKLRLEPPDISSHFDNILSLANDSMASGNVTYINSTITNEMFEIYYACIVFVGDQLGFEAPVGQISRASTEAEIVSGVLGDTFDTVFGYFFFCAGTVLILNGLLFLFGKRHKLPGEILEAGIRLFVGTCLSIVAIVSFVNSYDIQVAYNVLEFSPWMLPIVTLAYFLVIVIDTLLIWGMRRTLKRYNRV